jgi:serine phosphatase RsbU (regulator of sigma subunit)
VHLQITEPTGTFSVRPLRGSSFIIGRAVESDIPLRSGVASRRHARLDVDPGTGVTITDLGSKNGVSLNGQRIPPSLAVPVTAADTVEICGFRMRLLQQPDTEALPPGEMRQSPTRTSLVDAAAVREYQDQLLSPVAGRPRGAPGVDLRIPHDEFLNAAVEIMATRDLYGVSQLLLDITQRVVGYDVGYVLAWDPETEAASVEAIRSQPGVGSPPVVSTSIINDVVTSAQPVLVDDARTDLRYDQADSVVGLGHSTAIAVPMLDSDGTVLRILYVLRTASSGPAYEEADALVLAYVVAVASLRFQMDVTSIEELREQLREEALQNRFLEGELSVGARIQHDLLPERMPELPGYELACLYQPCRILGGDFYDTQTLEDSRICFTLGDVSGKGVGAAMLMFSAVTVFRTLLLDSVNLALPRLMGRANRALIHTLLEGQFATVWTGLLDPATGSLCYSSSAHPALLIRGLDGSVEHLPTHGPPLGLFDDGTFREARLELAVGDMLLLYTDGLTETRRGDGEFFGSRRLATALGELRDRSCEAILAGVQERLADFGDGASPADDRACIIIKRTGA